MCALFCPAHLLLLDHPFADYFIDRGLNKGTGNRFTVPITFAVVGNVSPIDGNIRLKTNICFEPFRPGTTGFNGGAETLVGKPADKNLDSVFTPSDPVEPRILVTLTDKGDHVVSALPS